MAPSAFDVRARFDRLELQQVLDVLEPRRWSYATSLAINRIGQSVKSAERGEMRSVFDRPTAFTMNSLQLTPSTKTSLEARVWFKDPPRLGQVEHYLQPQVFGGARPHKRFELTLQRAGLLPQGRYLVPASAARLDANGNVSRGTYARVFADLQASPVGANTTARSKRRRRGRSTGFFYGNPGGRGRGIWERFHTAFGSAVKPVFLESSAPTYRRRFAFFDLAERTVDRVYRSAFEGAVDHTLRTSR